MRRSIQPRIQRDVIVNQTIFFEFFAGKTVVVFPTLVHEKIREKLRRFHGIRGVRNAVILLELEYVLLRVELDTVNRKIFMLHGGNKFVFVVSSIRGENPPLIEKSVFI